MPIRQLTDAAAQSTVAASITNSQTSVTVASASGFPAILAGGQLSVIMLDSGNPAWNPDVPLTTPYEYQQVDAIAGNVLTFGPGGGAAARSAFAGTTPVAFFAGATVAAVSLAEDIIASAGWKFDEQTPTGTSITIPTSGSIPASYLGVNFRHMEIEIVGRTNLAATNEAIGLRFNGDTGNNYFWSNLATTGATPAGTAPTTATSGLVGVLTAASASAGVPGAIKLWIPDYASTSWAKIWLATMGFQSGGTGFELALFQGNWSSTAALTSVTIRTNAGGSFVSPTRIITRLLP